MLRFNFLKIYIHLRLWGCNYRHRNKSLLANLLKPLAGEQFPVCLMMLLGLRKPSLGLLNYLWWQGCVPAGTRGHSCHKHLCCPRSSAAALARVSAVPRRQRPPNARSSRALKEQPGALCAGATKAPFYLEPCSAHPAHCWCCSNCSRSSRRGGTGLSVALVGCREWDWHILYLTQANVLAGLRQRGCLAGPPPQSGMYPIGQERQIKRSLKAPGPWVVPIWKSHDDFSF